MLECLAVCDSVSQHVAHIDGSIDVVGIRSGDFSFPGNEIFDHLDSEFQVFELIHNLKGG